MAAGRQGANHKGSGSISGSVGGGAAGGDSRAGPRAGRGRPGGARGANHPPAPSATGGSGGGRGRGNAGSNQRTSQPSSTANSERQDAQGSAAAGSAVEARPVKPEVRWSYDIACAMELLHVFLVRVVRRAVQTYCLLPACTLTPRPSREHLSVRGGGLSTHNTNKQQLSCRVCHFFCGGVVIIPFIWSYSVDCTSRSSILIS